MQCIVRECAFIAEPVLLTAILHWGPKPHMEIYIRLAATAICETLLFNLATEKHIHGSDYRVV